VHLVGFIIRILDSCYQFLKKTDKQFLNKPPDCNAFVVTDLNLVIKFLKQGLS
jgi:hypothetical protein